MASFFEALMLICFGLSWPVNLMRNIKARTAKGTSVWFILLITLGYVCGITAKIVSGNINYVFAVYIFNIIVVLMNLAVYFRNAALDQQAELDRVGANK